MIAAALGHVAVITPAVIEIRAGRTALEMLTTLGAMALPVLERFTAAAAHRHTVSRAMLAGALAAAAQVTLGMIGRTPDLTLKRIHARTMIGIAAGRIVTTEAAVTPKQAALEAGSMLAGILTQIGLIATADFRITEMGRSLLTLLVLRLGDAVLTHDRRSMTTFTGKVTFDTALGKAMLADTTDVTRIATLGRAVILAVTGAMSALAANGRHVFVAVTVIVTPLAAGRRTMIQTVTAHMTALAAVSSLVLQTITSQMSRFTAGSGSMALTIIDTVIRQSTGSLRMIALAGKMAFSAAGRRCMLLAVTIEMAPDAAGSAGMIGAIALKVARDPAGLRAVMILSIPLFMFGIAAGRLGCVICSQRTGRKAHQQAQHQQRRNQFLHHLFPPLSFPFFRTQKRLICFLYYITIQDLLSIPSG